MQFLTGGKSCALGFNPYEDEAAGQPHQRKHLFSLNRLIHGQPFRLSKENPIHDPAVAIGVICIELRVPRKLPVIRRVGPVGNRCVIR